MLGRIVDESNIFLDLVLQHYGILSFETLNRTAVEH